MDPEVRRICYFRAGETGELLGGDHIKHPDGNVYRLADCTFEADASVHLEEPEHMDPVALPVPAPEAPPPAAEPVVAPAPAPVAAAKTVKPAKESQASASSDGFAVQVAAVNVRNDADAIVKRLTGKGYAAFVEVAKPATGNPFRVRVGNFKTRREALAPIIGKYIQGPSA